jgi:hypothetical protein
VIGTYAAVLAVCGASLAIGQAAIALCGRREWSWLSPAVGLALLCAVCWGTVRMPGDGVASAVIVLALVIASVGFLWGRVEGGGEALRAGAPVALIALAATSLPFVVEGHFGILGTSFNPDMSQHLLATDRLADGAGSQLLNQGYPLGPHAIVVALNKGLGIGLVQGFSGLTVAVAVLTSLTALAAFAELSPLRRTAGALVVGFAYMVASYFAQGAFKETMQALFVLAFVLALRESAKRGWVEQPLRFVPAALIAAGSIYTYSFPGLVWLGPAVVIWAVLERLSAGGAGEGGVEDDPARSAPPSPATGPVAARAASLALIVFGVLTLPELGRMIDFKRFETFDPNGPGLGNLFGQVSPFEALGIWPSGDFRLAPGDGAVPAVGYYLGTAFASVLLLYGLAWCWVRRETAIIAGLVAAAAVYAAARLGGTPYTAAKAIEVAAPLAALTILLPLLGPAGRLCVSMRHKVAPEMLQGLVALFIAAAAGCSLLALANAPVGPTSYTSALTELRPLVAADSTLVLASPELLDEQHGVSYIAWELRGGRVCIEPDDEAGGLPPGGVRFIVTKGVVGVPPFDGFRVRRIDAPYVLWERTGRVPGMSDCPLIAVRQARQGPSN